MTSSLPSTCASEGESLCPLITGVSAVSKAVDARVGAREVEQDGNLLSNVHLVDARKAPQNSPDQPTDSSHLAASPLNAAPLTNKGSTEGHSAYWQASEAELIASLKAIKSTFECSKLISMPTNTQTHESTGFEASSSGHKTILPLPGVDSIGASGSSQLFVPAKSPQQLGYHYRAIGLAGEYLVMADLALSGFAPMKAGEGSFYDLVIEVNDRLLKVQVKTTNIGSNQCGRVGSPTACQFKVHRKAKVNGKVTNVPYKLSQLNIIALVCADTKEIAYFPYNEEKIKKICIQSRSRALTQHSKFNYFDQFTIHSALSKLAA